MNINREYLRVNMIVNMARDYLTIKEVASVGVMYVEDEQILDINVLNGMAGHSFQVDVADILEEDDPAVMIKMLLIALKDQ